MRIKRLDILRCAAVLLVVTGHAGMFSLISRVGWAGVDLFFVLSGFLISGLLYSEYKERGYISLRRFFIRRGMKIYPAFYAMLLATYLGQLLFWHFPPQPFSTYLREILFVQNYRFAIWGHTWSLAVEEHFYIALAVLFLLLARYSTNREDPFQKVPQIFAFVAVTCLALRILTIWLTPPAKFVTSQVMNLTHTRIDALFFGVLLGYFYHFHPDSLTNFCRPTLNRFVLGILSVAALSSCYFFTRDDDFQLSLGLTLLYLGFGGLLILCLEVRDVFKGRTARIIQKIGTACAFVGTYSYSIYLWHAPFQVNVPVFLREFIHLKTSGLASTGFYVWGSCILGIAMAKLIEIPVLRIRDRYFPRLRHSEVKSTQQEPKNTSPPGEPLSQLRSNDA
jgi:peptidoglycan/LPS O-acetylase OafA/YrhL